MKTNKTPKKTYALGVDDGLRIYRETIADYVSKLKKLTVDSTSRKEVSDSTIYEVELHNAAVDCLRASVSNEDFQKRNAALAMQQLSPIFGRQAVKDALRKNSP